jgi:endo-1,4-beta-xylanase
MRHLRWIACLAVAAGFSAPALFAQEIAYAQTPLFAADFEDGTAQAWAGRGSGANIEKIEVVAGQGRGGGRALRISDRRTTWMGPQRLLAESVQPGEVYRVSIWVRYDQGPIQTGFVLSVERSFKDAAAEHRYTNVVTVQAKRGEWTQIAANYTIPNDPTQKSIWVYIERPYKADNVATDDDKMPFMIDDAAAWRLDPQSKPTIQADIPALRAVWSGRFAIGAAVTPEDVDPTEAHGQLLAKHFNALVAGNAMKWESLQPREGVFIWDEADRLVEFAQKNGMKLRGHTLIWHNQTPSWVFLDPKDMTKPASPELLAQRLKTHIETVVAHFKGKVSSWDVVNEALSDTDGLRTGAEGSKWMQILGPRYIDLAFQYARAADPAARLVYNDYNLESDPRKLDAAVALVSGLRARGVPVDGVGLQMHVRIDYPVLSQVRAAIAKLAALGVKVEVTELDVSIYSGPEEAKKTPDAAVLLAQAQRYKDLFAVFGEAADRGWLDSVVLWGLADDGTWLDNFPVQGRPDAPLLFDRVLRAKPAFWAVVDPGKVAGLR